MLKSALRDHLKTIHYVYSFLFPKIYNRINRFRINNKSHFDFIFPNWRHHKSNLALPTRTKNKVIEQSIKKIIPEIDITQKNNNKMKKKKKKFYALVKKPESCEKRVVHLFEQKP